MKANSIKEKKHLVTLCCKALYDAQLKNTLLCIVVVGVMLCFMEKNIFPPSFTHCMKEAMVKVVSSGEIFVF